ncbi:MAG: hypothetical protein CEO19_313 [Parcubacteria group bacterium Gr01-1014_73]|nr:MAG: hypothetical protein CEO19_313 [Parcubacteria group bacterium Gr01-1014_73]
MNKRGFTLIELLVVISIISLLSSVVMSSLSSARAKARDAKRLHDLRQINIALALYYDKYSYYPYCPADLDSAEFIINGTTECLSLALISEGFMSKVPIDPLATVGGTWGRDYSYYWATNGTDYIIRASLEGKPVSRTGSYPSGATCNSAPTYPVCGWYSTCVYTGFNSGATDCNILGYALSN